MTAGRRVALAAPVLAVWAWHTAEHVLEGHAGEALWSCIVGELLLALGLLASRPSLLGVGALWVLFGLPLFALTVADGEARTLASWTSHTFGPAAALVAVRGLGLPRGTWWRATLALLGLQGLSRLITAPELDVNLAFAVHPGWEGLFPSWPVYEVFMIALATSSFALLELGLRRALVREEPAPAPVEREPAGARA